MNFIYTNMVGLLTVGTWIEQKSFPHSRYGSKTLHPQTSSTMHANYQYTQKKERVITLWGSLPTTEGERLSDAETDRLKREAASATEARGSDGVGSSRRRCRRRSDRERLRVRESSTSRERERLRVRGRDWSLNLVFFFNVLRWFKLLCAWSCRRRSDRERLRVRSRLLVRERDWEWEGETEVWT